MHQLPSFFSDNTHQLIDKISNALCIDINDVKDNGTLDDFFLDLKQNLDEIAKCNPTAQSFLRFIRAQESRLGSCFLRGENVDNLLMFISVCHYYFNY